MTEDQPPALVVRDDADHHRYVVTADGVLAGFAAYRPAGEQLVFFHTEIEPAFEGRGVGSVLARTALDDVRARGLRVVPICPFIAAYIRRHPEYQDLVTER